MKPLPGYVKAQRIIAVDELWLHSYPAQEVRKMIAHATGDLLAEALMSESIDTTQPLYVDGAHRTGVEMFTDIREVKVELHYVPRSPHRDELETGACAIAPGHLPLNRQFP